MKNSPSLDGVSEAQVPNNYSTFSQDFFQPTIGKNTQENALDLAHELQAKGEKYLLQGDLSGVQFFTMATDLQPENGTLYYSQGLALFEYGLAHNSLKELRSAIKMFRKGSKYLTSSMNLYQAWGNTLYSLGQLTSNHAHFITAKNKYKKALALSEDQTNDVISELHWDYGNTWTKIAEDSGEAIDLNIAIQSYEKASSLQNDMPPEFWQNYGEATLKLGQHTNDVRLFVKAIDCYKNSISLSISSYEGWFELAKALVELYTFTQDEDHFSQANECFSTAAKFQANHAEIWITWAQLLLESGSSLKDKKKLYSAIEKCQRASLCDPTSAKVIFVWAESLCNLGVLTDTLEYINDAENKIASLKLSEKTPEFYHAEGMCLLSQAHYFQDLDLYYQAIEKFQTGLSIRRSYHKLWFALGYTYLQCYPLDNDPKILELASKFFGKALNLHLSSNYHYHFALANFKLGDIQRNEQLVESAVSHFEHAFSLQNNAIYLYPEWTFEYACALDTLGDFTDEHSYYAKSLDILNHVLMVDPDFPGIHYQIGLVYAHYADLISDKELFFPSFHHFRLAHTKDAENDQIILDWGLTIMNFALLTAIPNQATSSLQEAECKLIKAAKLGNEQAYYYLGCLYSLLQKYEKSLQFLMKAHQASALPPLQELLQDDWLDNMKSTEEFRDFIYHIEQSAHSSEG